MTPSFEYQTSDYITDIVIWLIIFKLLRFDMMAKYLSLSFMLIIVPLGYLLMILSTLLFPFVLLNFNDEQLGIALKIIAPTVVIFLAYIYRTQIIDTMIEFWMEFKNESVKMSGNLAKDLRSNSDFNKLSEKYFEILKNEIDVHIFYVIPIFVFLLYIIYCAYDYPHLIPLPAFGFLYGIEVNYWYSKWNLIWLLPLVGAITFLYSKYYLTAVLSPVYEKFNAICVLMSRGNETVVMNKYFNLKVINDEQIEEYYAVADTLNFLKSNDEIFFIFDKKLNCRKFKSVYIHLKIDGQKYFKTEFYDSFE